MVDFTKDKTWAATQTIENDADSSNVGKGAVSDFTEDLDSVTTNSFMHIGSGSTNKPAGSVAGRLLTIARSGDETSQIFMDRTVDKMHFRRQTATVWTTWNEVLHSGNIGGALFNDATISGADVVVVSVAGLPERTRHVNIGTASNIAIEFINDNGVVGSIVKNGTATAYNVSSDPRLKSEFVSFDSTEAWAKFDSILACSGKFNFLSEPNKEVWGFNAHAVIDAGFDIGTEGEGPRDALLGDIYQTVPAVMGEIVQQVVYKSGENKGKLRFNADDSPMMETVDVELSPEIQKKVSPAGVDQSKVVPYLIAVIDDLRNRLDAAGI